MMTQLCGSGGQVGCELICNNVGCNNYEAERGSRLFRGTWWHEQDEVIGD